MTNNNKQRIESMRNQDNNDCQHYWVLTDGAGVIRGTCHICGAEKTWPWELPWDFRKWRPATPVLDFIGERGKRV